MVPVSVKQVLFNVWSPRVTVIASHVTGLGLDFPNQIDKVMLVPNNLLKSNLKGSYRKKFFRVNLHLL